MHSDPYEDPFFGAEDELERLFRQFLFRGLTVCGALFLVAMALFVVAALIGDG